MFESKIKGGKVHALMFMAIWIAVCIAILGLNACGEMEFTDAQHVQRAKNFQDQGDLRSSMIELKSALQKNPNNPEARWLLGQIYVETGIGNSAEKELRRAQELGVAREAILTPLLKAMLLQGKTEELLKTKFPESLALADKAELYAIRGEAHLFDKNLEKAAKEFNTALDIKSDVVSAQIGLALLASMEGRFEYARQQVDKIIKINSRNAAAWSLLGDLSANEGKAEEAEQAYSNAISNRYDNLSDHIKRGQVRIYLEKFDDAMRDIAAIKRRAPRSPLGYHAEGLLKFKQNQYAEAQADFESALQQNPNYMPSVLFLGASHAAQGHRQAEQLLYQFLNAFPQSYPARVLLGVARLQDKDFADAISVLKPLLASNPDDAKVLELIGTSYLGQGKTSEGIEYLQRAVALQPGTAATHVKLGLSLMMQGDREQGIGEIEAAIELDAKQEQVETLLVYSYLRAREFGKALDAAKRFQAKDPGNAPAITLTALVYMAKGDDSNARALLNEALEVAPGDPGAASALARLEIKHGNTDKAKSLYQEVLKHHPGHLPALMELAAFDATEGNIEKAKIWLEQTVEANPTELQPRVLLARHYLRLGQPSRALTLMREVEEEYPKHPLLLAELGRAQLAMDEYANALASFGTLLQIRPGSVGAHYYLAKTHSATGDLNRMRQHLNQALRLNPEHFLSKLAMARLLTLENKADAADKLVGELKTSHPRHADVYMLEGWIATRRNQSQAAIQAYSEALKLAPGSELTVTYAQALWQSGEQEQARTTLEAWLQDQPEDLLVRYALAESYLSLGQSKAAETAFAKVVDQAPNHVPALNNLAWLLRKDDPNQAITYAERALKLAPDAPDVMDTMGMLLLNQGKNERATRLLQKAEERASKNPTIRYHLALALSRNGDKDRAQQILRELVEGDTAFAEKQEAQALLESLNK